tara:strand:- start:4 stop:150 length:147 start_codon:yes stop_codon:yes gene_type:complete
MGSDTGENMPQETTSIGMRLMSKYGEALLILAIWVHVLGYMFELWKRY